MVKNFFLGNIHYLKENNFEISENLQEKSQNLENEANTVSYLTIDGKAVAVFGFKDKIKENAKSAIKFYKIKALKLS
jgi:cation transport ATPase